MILDFLKPLADGFNAVRGVIDDLHHSGEEKDEALLKLTTLENQLTVTMMQAHIELARVQADVIKTEATGNWLQRSWRPILMFVIMAIIFNNYVVVGYIPGAVVLDLPAALLGLMTVGVGGYVGGRTWEKTSKKTSELEAEVVRLEAVIEKMQQELDFVHQELTKALQQ